MKELSQPDTTTRRVQTRWAIRPVIGFSIHPLLSREAELLRLLQELALLRQRDACDWAAGHANVRARDALHLLLRLTPRPRALVSQCARDKHLTRLLDRAELFLRRLVLLVCR